MTYQSTNPINQKNIEVTVLKKLPHGLLVRAANETLGIIRSREIAWEMKDDWRNIYHRGDKLNVVQIGSNQKSVEFSLRLAQYDPWQHAPKNYHINQLVVGRVQSVDQHKAWIEVEPGIIGILTLNDLPKWIKPLSNMSDFFWLEDEVQATITNISFQEREIKLNLHQAHLQRNKNTSDYFASLAKQHKHIQTKKLNYRKILAKLPSKRIWLVEDDSAQSDAIGLWLQSNGYQVEAFLSAEACIAQIEMGRRCDIILTDVGLPKMDGIEFLSYLARTVPNINCVLMTDLFRLSYSERIGELLEAGFSILCKPILPEDIADFLQRLHKGTGTTKRVRRTPISPIAQNIQSKDNKQLKKQALIELIRKTSAEKVLLFSFDPVTRKINLVDAVGKGVLHQPAIQKLIYSPVRDVAEDKMIVEVSNIPKEAEYVRYLADYIAFGSCVGVPVSSETNMAYALFLFHTHNNFFLHTHIDYAHATAFRLTAIIEREQLIYEVTSMQKLAMLGNLSRSMVHEINHKLGPIAFAIEDLEEQCTKASLALEQGSVATENALNDAANFVLNLSKGIDGLIHTTKLFGDLTAQTGRELVKLNETINDVVWIMKDLAHEYHVIVECEKPKKLFFTQANPSELKQVLLNVITNSIQQIDAMRCDLNAFTGKIQVSVDTVRLKQETHIEIKITDNGPGIHHAIWERIFDCGFTLGRRDGSGLGLFISRNLMHNMGGEIFVQNSQRLWGTTFVVRLPISLRGGKSWQSIS